MSVVQKGYNWDDFLTLPLIAGAAQTRYYVGTSMLVADSAALLIAFPVLARNPDNGQPGFTAQKILIYPTQNCQIRFNGAARIQHTFFKNDYVWLEPKVHTIYASMPLVNGILYVHFEG